MTPINIDASETTPRVSFDADTRQLLIEGESYPENVVTFYRPVADWLRDYLAGGGDLHLRLNLRYLNTSSTKALLDILDQLEEAHEDGGEIRVTWVYKNGMEVMKEAGEEFKEDFSLPFELVAE